MIALHSSEFGVVYNTSDKSESFPRTKSFVGDSKYVGDSLGNLKIPFETELNIISATLNENLQQQTLRTVNEFVLQK